MSFTGSLRQHWTNQNIGSLIGFPTQAGSNTDLLVPTSQASYITAQNNLLKVASGDTKNELTFSVWLFPRFRLGESTNDLGYRRHLIFSSQSTDTSASPWANKDYLLIDTGGNVKLAINYLFIDAFYGVTSAQDNPPGHRGVGGLIYEQWNHLILSIQRTSSNAIAGKIGGGRNHILKKDTEYNGYNTTRLHLAVNGTVYSRYVQPNQPGESDLTGTGFLYNDFMTATNSNGYYGINTYNDELFSTATKDSIIGSKLVNDGTLKGADFYRGDMYQFYLKNSYYDLTDPNNLALFRNSNNTPLPTLPSNPRVFFTGDPNSTGPQDVRNVGQTGLGTLGFNNINPSSTARP